MSRRRQQLSSGDREAVAGLLGPTALTAGTDGAMSRAQPASVAEVAALLRLSRTRRFPVWIEAAPPAAAGGLVLDLAHFRDVGAVDSRSLLVEVGAGARSDAVDAAAQRAGYRLLAPLPPERTVGAALATTPTPAAAWRGGQPEPVASLVVVCADGTEVHSRTAPRSATGPDLMHLLLGTRGRLGVLLRVTLRLEPLGLAHAELAWAFTDGAAASAAAGQLAARGAIWPRSASHIERDGQAVLAVVLSGHAGPVAAAASLARRVAAEAGGGELSARETREVFDQLDPPAPEVEPGPLDAVFERLRRQLDPHDLLNPGVT